MISIIVMLVMFLAYETALREKAAFQCHCFYSQTNCTDLYTNLDI